MKENGIDTDKLNEFMGGAAGGDGKMPNMQDSMKMMSDMMNSPIFKEYMKDPERLEQSRQMILNNPMLQGMLKGMPGMEEVINDKDAWRESMMAAAELYKNMNTNQLMQAMMGQQNN